MPFHHIKNSAIMLQQLQFKLLLIQKIPDLFSLLFLNIYNFKAKTLYVSLLMTC